MDGRRGVFSAKLERFGSRQPYKGPPVKTLCMIDVRDGRGEPVADHLWFTDCKAWRGAGVKPGDIVQFTARVKAYTKGYRGRRDDDEGAGPTTDWKLAFPGDVRVIEFRGEKAETDPRQGELF